MWVLRVGELLCTFTVYGILYTSLLHVQSQSQILQQMESWGHWECLDAMML